MSLRRKVVVYVAMEDYKAINKSELSFAKGEKMKITKAPKDDDK